MVEPRRARSHLAQPLPSVIRFQGAGSRRLAANCFTFRQMHLFNLCATRCADFSFFALE